MSDSNIQINLQSRKHNVHREIPYLNINKNIKMLSNRYRNMMSIFNGNRGIVKTQECGSC